LSTIEALQEAAQFGLRKRVWDGTARPWCGANHGARQAYWRSTSEVEKLQKASQCRSQHVEGTALETTSTVADKTVDVLRPERPQPQGPPPKAPLQKLPNEEPINGPCCLSQPGDLIQVPIILAAQPFDARGALCGFDYAEVAGGLARLYVSITMRDWLHGER
jgi:hypothetical protein